MIEGNSGGGAVRGKRSAGGRGVRVVLVTCPNKTVARRLANALIARRLAACVNTLPGVESIFRWQGRVDRCREVLLIVKTTASAVARLRRIVCALHPYDVPEVMALPVVAGHRPYLQWVAESVRPVGRKA